MRLVTAILAAGLATGCNLSLERSRLDGLLALGEVRVMPHPSDRALVIVQHLNRRLPGGIDLDRPEGRRAMVGELLGAQCGEPEIIDARVTLTGAPGARPFTRTYTLAVRCPNGASSAAER